MNTMTAICPTCGYQHDTDAKGFEKLHEEWAKLTPPASVDAGTRTTKQIAEAVAQQFCVCTKQADSTEEYLVSLIEAALNQDRASTNQIIKDDAEELSALTAQRATLADQLEEAKEISEAALKEVQWFQDQCKQAQISTLDIVHVVTGQRDELTRIAAQIEADAYKLQGERSLKSEFMADLQKQNDYYRSALAEKENDVAGYRAAAETNATLVNDLQDRLAILEADKRRLDWLEKHEWSMSLTEPWTPSTSPVHLITISGVTKALTLRAAIDSALSANPRLLSEGGEGK